MGNAGLIKPTNKLVVTGKPKVQELNVETATNVIAGRLAKKGTNDDDVVVATAGCVPAGWIGYENTAPVYQPDDMDTEYAQGDKIAVLRGKEFALISKLASGESVNKDDPLVTAGDGMLKAASDLAVSSGSDTASAVDGTTPALEGSVPPEGPIVAYAAETVDASGGAKDIIVWSNL